MKGGDFKQQFKQKGDSSSPLFLKTVLELELRVSPMQGRCFATSSMSLSQIWFCILFLVFEIGSP